MYSVPRRMVLGAGAAIVSVLIFHQGMWAVLHNLAIPGLTMPPPYQGDATQPFGVPRIISLCFWGGMWGALFALFWRGSKGSFLFGGFWLGVASVLVGFFLVAPLKGIPLGGNGEFDIWLRALLTNISWGLGTGGILAVVNDAKSTEDHAL